MQKIAKKLLKKGLFYAIFKLEKDMPNKNGFVQKTLQKFQQLFHHQIQIKV